MPAEAPPATLPRELRGRAALNSSPPRPSTAIDSSVRLSYAVFSAQLTQWSGRVKTLALQPVGSRPCAPRARQENWRCGDVTFLIDRLGFDQLGPARAGILDAVPTRFVLPADQIDLLVQAGADALRGSRSYQAFRRRSLTTGASLTSRMS